MEASEAREHLRWVDGILRTADRSLHVPPVTLIVWGLFGAIVNGLHQASASGWAVPSDGTIQLPMLAVAFAISIWAAGRMPSGRQTLVDAHAGVVFAITFGVLMLLNITAQDTVIPLKAMSLFWAVGFSMALMIVGTQASRRFVIGGVAMFTFSLIACLSPSGFDGILAVAWAIGFVGTGAALALGHSDGRPAAV